MKKLLTGILIFGLAILSVAGAVFYYAKSNDFFFPLIKEQLKESTGYLLAKDGVLEATLLPRIKLTARNLKIGNPSSSMGGQLLKTERLSLALDWLSILRLDIVLDIELDITEIDLQIDETGSANWLASKLQGESAEFPFNLGNIDARQTQFRFRNNQTQEILGLDLDQVSIDLVEGRANTHINTAGRYGNTRFLAQGELIYIAKNKQFDLNLAVSAGAAGDKKVATIKVPSISDWIEQNVVSFPLSGKLIGSFSFKDMLPNGKLSFDAEALTIGGISYLNKNIKHLREELGPLVVSGVLQLNGGDLDIVDFQAKLDHQRQPNIAIKGAIQNLLSEPQADLKVKSQASHLDQVLASSPVAAIDQSLISRLKNINFNASIYNNSAGLHISDMGLQFSHGGLDTGVTGAIDITKLSVLTNLKIDGQAENAGDLLDLFGIEKNLAGEPGPFTISAKISSENDRYLIEQSTLNTQDGRIKMTASGSFNAMDRGLNFDLDSSLDVKDLPRLAEIFLEDPQPHLKGISGNASAKFNGTLENFSISGAQLDLYQDGSTLHLEGRLSQLPENLIPEIDVHYSTEHPIDLEQYFPKLVGLQLTGPLELSAVLRAINNKIFVQRIRFQAKQTDVEGEIIVDLGLSPPRISATLSSRRFITSLVENEPETLSPEVEEVDLETASQANLPAEEKLSAKELGERFKAYTSSIEIKTDWIDQLDIYFSYTAAKAQIGDYEADNLALIINASEGIFKLVKYQLELEDKPIFFSGLINTNTSPPQYEFIGELKGDTLEALFNAEDGLLEGGQLSGDFKLDSEGMNLGQLIENLDGHALITMGPLTIKSEALSFVSSSIFSAMLGGLMRKKDDEPASIYECGVLGIDIDKGVARVNKAFALQAKDYNLAGSGTIDLNTGAVDLGVNPKARKGLGLSISTIIGGFKIKGYMATPDFGVGGGGLISAVVVGYALAPVVLAGAATNPVSATIVASGFLLTGIVDRMTASNYTCENTLKRIERNRSKAAALPEPEIKF